MLPPPPLDPASWLAAIVASSQDAIVSKTVDGIITSWNASAERMYGYTADEAIGRSILLIVPDDRHEEEREILRMIADGKRVEHFDTERRTKDGRTVPVSLTISPVVDADGRIVGASKIARDITERRSSEELLRLADRRKDEFLAMLGHELRNPLGPVLSAVEVLRRKSTIDADLREICDMLGRQVGQMARLLDDLLEVSRISSGKIEMRMEPVDLRTVIDRAIEALRPAIDQRRHALAVDLPDMPTIVQGDPARLVQLFSNLLNNAAKYTPAEGVISIVATCDEERCQVEITDSGLVIAPDLIDGIFELFVQGESTIDRAQGGLGVGLTLARSIVQRHGGTITAHSEGPGKGSRFVVCLPRHAEPVAAQPVTPHREHAAAVRHVLVVDDNRDSAWMMAELVRSLGHQAEGLVDPDGAIDAIVLKQPDIVLLDIGLPGLSGYDIAAAVRERGFRGLLVAVTGYGQPGDRLRSRVAGFDLHWVKPVPPQALADLLSTEIA
jgi:PAS domain S-box-containing protein